jgi:hypothetical protein
MRLRTVCQLLMTFHTLGRHPNMAVERGAHGLSWLVGYAACGCESNTASLESATLRGTYALTCGGVL